MPQLCIRLFKGPEAFDNLLKISLLSYSAFKTPSFSRILNKKSSYPKMYSEDLSCPTVSGNYLSCPMVSSKNLVAKYFLISVVQYSFQRTFVAQQFHQRTWIVQRYLWRTLDAQMSLKSPYGIGTASLKFVLGPNVTLDNYYVRRIITIDHHNTSLCILWCRNQATPYETRTQ